MAHDVLSSPDPLALSNENISTISPMKARGTVLTPRKALSNTSGNTHVQEFYLNTPPPRKRSPTKSPNHRAQSTSPWRIRLTLQAEQFNETQGAFLSNNTPTKCLAERRTTITVPLKGGDETPPAVEKRGRGRPRKSLDAAVKRNVTPKPKKAARTKTVPESLEEQDDDLIFVKTTPPKKAKGRPRKSLEPVMDIPQSVQISATSRMPEKDNAGKDVVEKPARGRSRARRREISPINIAVGSDYESPICSRRFDEGLNESKALTPHDNNEEVNLVSGNELPQTTEVPETQDPILSPETPFVEDQDEAMWQALSRRKSQNSTEEDQGDTDIDPTNEHQEYDTVLESEGFSMVSVSSLASSGSRSYDSAEKAEGNRFHNQSLIASTSPRVAPALDDAQVLSEPIKALQAREHTPSVALSAPVPDAPRNAPPQSQRRLEKATDGTPKLTRVVRAGSALQGVLSTKEQKSGSPFRPSNEASSHLTTENAAAPNSATSPLSGAKSPRDRLDDLFNGFGAGTRRELKAGLRLGEELARRQRLKAQKTASSPIGLTYNVFSENPEPLYPLTSDDNDTTNDSLKALGPVEEVQYPVLANTQLPSPKLSEEDLDEDRMSWKADTPVKTERPASESDQVFEQDVAHIPRNAPPVPSDAKMSAPDTSGVDYRMLAREAEWQREREAISREIEMANKSHVIVIDDTTQEIQDISEGDEEDSDVWQAEANESREPKSEASEIVEQLELMKPRRSKLPSPWRRNSEVVYSNKVEPTEADLSWQSDKSKPAASTRPQLHSPDQPESSNSALLEQPLKHTDRSNGKTSPIASSKSQSLEISAMAGSSSDIHGSLKLEAVQLPRTPEQKYTEDYSEVFGGDMTLTPVSDKTVDSNDASPGEPTALVDPLLLRAQPQKQLQKRPQNPPGPIRTVTQPQQSWLSRLTAPIWRALTSLPPPATKEDILSSGPYEPLCQFTPWENCHTRALTALYYASLLYGSHIFPYDQTKDSCVYLGMKIKTPLGWSRSVTMADIGVCNAFNVLLDERGFALGQPGEEWIDDFIIFHQIVNVWVSMVMKGEVELDKSKGERSGLRKQGNRMWTKEDIDWSGNRTEYFERKKKEFDGLPSWKAKGIKYGAA